MFLCSCTFLYLYPFLLYHKKTSAQKNFKTISLITCKKLQEQQEQQEHRAITPSLQEHFWLLQEHFTGTQEHSTGTELYRAFLAVFWDRNILIGAEKNRDFCRNIFLA